MYKDIINFLKSLLKVNNDALPPGRIHITDGADYSNASGFRLYVGVAGDVTYVDYKGNTGTHNFTAGYHPSKIVSITGATTTATDLAACV